MISTVRLQPCHLVVQDNKGDDLIEYTGMINANIEPVTHLKRAIRKLLKEDPYRYSLDECPLFRCEFSTMVGITTARFQGSTLESAHFYKNGEQE